MASSKKKYQNSVTIMANPDEISSFLKNPRNLSNLMEDENRGKDPNNFKQLDVETLEDRLGLDLAWMCYENGDIERAGFFNFTPTSRGTTVRLFLEEDESESKILDKIFGKDIETFVLRTLRRLKAYMETGEIPTTEGQPNGREGESYASAMLGR